MAVDARSRYLLRIADTCLIHAQRLAEWAGHAPVLEEDIALANIALDLLGQARGLLSHLGDEDRLAFHRDERDFCNATLVELPLRPDFAATVLRNVVVAAWLLPLWTRLEASADAEVAAVAAKAVKEVRYHHRHAADWVVRLGDGSDESARRMRVALDRAWPYCSELFAADAVDAEAEATGLGPSRAALRDDWQRDVAAVLADATLTVPAPTPFLSTGMQGRHSEHMGPLLAEMQVLQRTFPGGRW